MATAHVQTKDAQAASAASVGVSLTGVGSGHHLVIQTTIGAINGLTAASPGTPTSSPSSTISAGIAGFVSSAADQAFRIDYTENTASGSWTVTAHGPSGKEITCIVSESSGVATSSSIGATAHNAAGTATTCQPGSITPASGSIVYTHTSDDGGATTADTISSPYTVVSDSTAWNGSNQRSGAAVNANVSASATNPTWTAPAGANTVMGSIIEFKAAAAIQDTPELDGRPFGLLGQNQMQQLLAT